MMQSIRKRVVVDRTRSGRLVPAKHAAGRRSRLGVSGWVRNRPDGGGVEAVFEGPSMLVGMRRSIGARHWPRTGIGRSHRGK